jgi:serine/threonine-protein kinase HipA
MASLDVFLAADRVGTLSFDPGTSAWSFAYGSGWVEREDGYNLSPALPRASAPAVTAESHSQSVRKFFENLLPEGQALDDAAQFAKVSKSNAFGLLVALGRETAGALRLMSADGTVATPAQPDQRPLSRAEVSERIRSRPQLPFTVWDQRVRLSISGYQDKLAVLEEDDQWSLVGGSALASTHLVKPEPVNADYAGLTTNEYWCMQFAQALGLAVAPTRLEFIPEPVLVVERFDRRRITGPQGLTVERLHCFDGCQALDLPAAAKYERVFGSGEAVKHIRDGASLRLLFALVREQAAVPARAQIELLRWCILQVLIANLDAHAKNLTFFYGPGGLTLAPAYDLTCGLVYPKLEAELAMAIGDEFGPTAVQAFDWARFTLDCALPETLVARELTRMSRAAMTYLPQVTDQVREAGGHVVTLDRVSQIVSAQAESLANAAPGVVALVRDERKT